MVRPSGSLLEIRRSHACEEEDRRRILAPIHTHSYSKRSLQPIKISANKGAIFTQQLNSKIKAGTSKGVKSKKTNASRAGQAEISLRLYL
jgi:hypothetical protein